MSSTSLSELFSLQKVYKSEANLSTAEQRKEKLKAVLNWTYSHKPDIRKALYQDFRKPETETDLTEIFGVTSELKHSIRHLKRWMRPKPVRPILSQLTNFGYIQYQPKGTVLIINPWNYPFLLAMAPLASALAAGNTVILKPSEMAPHTSALIETMVGELFEPREVAVVQGDSQVAAKLLELPFDHIFFTGSTAVGKIVMKAAADHLSSVTLELGGKSPVIVDETANIEDAAQKIVWGKFLNNGQTCIAPDYVYIHDSIYEKFMRSVHEYISKMYGNGSEKQRESIHYARIINDHHFNRLAAMLKNATDSGARVEHGGQTDSDDRYIQPTVLADFAEDSAINRQEVFGPLLAVHRYFDIDEVLQRINSGDRPLSMYIFSTNATAIKYISKRSTSGTLVINDALVQFAHYRLPFGGVNASGFGNSHGFFGFKAFSHERAVLKNLGLSPFKTIFPPYTRRVQKLVDIFVRWL